MPRGFGTGTGTDTDTDTDTDVTPKRFTFEMMLSHHFDQYFLELRDCTL